MRILFCNYEYPPLGGGGGVINKLIAEQLAVNHEVDVLTSQGMGLPAYSNENGVSIHRAPVFFRSRQAAANIPSMVSYLPSGYIKGRRLVRNRQYDVINTHFVVPTGPLGNWLSKKFDVPNVLSVHGGDLYDPSKWTSPHRHALLRSSINHLLEVADAVVGQSQNTLDNVHRFYNRDIKCECIPLGIKRPETGERAARDAFGIADSDIVLVTVGRLVARKAAEQMIRMVSEFDNKNVKLIIIGSGPQEDMLKQLADGLGVADRIIFLGQAGEEQKFEVLRMADVYVSTSQHEGFGIVYLEAMSSGLPIVCYDYGGQTDFLESDKNGFVVHLNDTAAFRSQCEKLINDPTLRQKFGSQNKLDVEKFYIDNCANRYLDLFERVIEQRRTTINQ